MQTYYNKLKDLLCECEAVNKDIYELRFWTLVNTKNYWIVKLYNLANFLYEDKYLLHNLYTNSWWFEIIWNNLEYHHLMMYYDYINLDLAEKISKECPAEEPNVICNFTNIWLKEHKKEFLELIFNWDNTKPFHLQSEEVFKNIYEYLESNK